LAHWFRPIPAEMAPFFAGPTDYAPLLAKHSETEGPEFGLQEFRQKLCVRCDTYALDLTGDQAMLTIEKDCDGCVTRLQI